MASFFSPDKPLEILNNYFSALEKNGRISKTTVHSIMAYLFLLDFVSLCAEHVTDEGYSLIRKTMYKLFSNGDCLMPYPIFSMYRTQSEEDVVVDNKVYRQSEVGELDRAAEYGDSRIKE